jgi:hypothetical protein
LDPFKRDIDFRLERPLEDLDDDMVMELAADAIRAHPTNLELLTLVHLEIREREKDLEAFEALLAEKDAKVIRWLSGLRYRVRSLVESFDWDPGPGRNNKVYFILLCDQGLSGPPHPWGLYVGQTYRKIEVRLKQHLDPSQQLGSRRVARRGWNLLYSVGGLTPTMKQKDALRFEKLILASLRGQGRNKPLRGLPSKRVKGA